MGSLSGMERGRLLSLINLPESLFISLACSPENISNHSVCNMTIDKSGIIGGICTGNPFVSVSYTQLDAGQFTETSHVGDGDCSDNCCRRIQHTDIGKTGYSEAERRCV